MSTKKLNVADPYPNEAVPDAGLNPSSRDRILAAASQEFAAKGYAGARIDAIAAAANANKQLIYHYFENKAGLYKAVRTSFSELIRLLAATAPTDLAERVDAFTDAALSAELAALIRMNQWAALGATEDDDWIPDEGQRELGAFVEALRRDQQVGSLGADLDPDLVLLMLIAVTTYPRAYPGAVGNLTGQSVDDPAFQVRFRSFMTALARHLGATPR
jgi:TetR/AcrR family transcriptional regulator